ncbi:MAG: putative toxin-antitoxin system toxin component, PIN family [Gemmatimonadales bacterium]|nr:MAG: putative toxin-antitoxin system toxin component, PIN family [Gemmatimonadales bacterium]
MGVHDVVLDTNVLISALRSRRGASFRLLSMLGIRPDLQVHVSVPLVLEYEQVAKRQAGELGLDPGDIDDVLDYLCQVAVRHEIYYLWRPVLRDPGDDMVLEAAVAGGCSFIVSYNKRDFEGAARFGIEVVTARELLQRMGELR